MLRTSWVAAGLLLSALALGALPGCARNLEMRVARLEWENEQLKRQVDSLSADVRSLARRAGTLPPGLWRPEAARPEPERRPDVPPPFKGRPPGGHPKGRRP